MNRGDHREDIFRSDTNRWLFRSTLEEACEKTGWQIHGYCFMSNHFHPVLETPNANLVEGMKWLLGIYTKRFNSRHQVFGHLFSRGYKALLVEGSGNGYLKTVCDYVHLNPVRAVCSTPSNRWRLTPGAAFRFASPIVRSRCGCVSAGCRAAL